MRTSEPPAATFRDALLPGLLGAAGYALFELAFFAERNLLLPWSTSPVPLAVLFFALHAIVALSAGALAVFLTRRASPTAAPLFPAFAPLAALFAVHAVTYYRESLNSLPRDAVGTIVSVALPLMLFAAAWGAARALRLHAGAARATALTIAAGLLVFGAIRVTRARPMEEESPVSTPRPSGDRLKAEETGARVLVFGFDGATWDVLDVLIAEGRMPNLAALAARGRTFELETLRPTFSPILWTSIATGKTRFQHGIHDVLQSTLPGGITLRRSVERTAFLTKTTGVLFRLLEKRHLLKLSGYRSSQVHATSVFDAASEAGLPATRIEWYVSWPAVPLSGVDVSDRFHLQSTGKELLPGAVAPDSMNAALLPFVTTPENVPLVDVLGLVDAAGLNAEELRAWAQARPSFIEEMRINLARDRTTRNVAVELLRRDPDWRLFGVYFRAVDVSHHLTWKYRRAEGDASALAGSPELRLRTVVDRYHEVMDVIVGEVLAAAPPDAAVLVLSDHGFEDRYAHSRAPRGFAIAAGAPFTPSAERGVLGVYDVAPTLATILGLPVAEDFAAAPRTDLLDSAFVASHPLRRISTWEREGREAGSSALGGVLDGMDEAEVERLRAIGYIQ